jgi:hypothetical protein
VDDYRIEIAERHNNEVLAAAEEIDHDMQAALTRSGMQQAPEKQEIYATNPELERQLGRMLHIEQHKQGVAAMLGVDLFFCKKVRKGLRRRGKLAQRLAKHEARSRLVNAKLAGCRQASRAAKRIYATGVLRGAVYGAEVTKYTTGQLQAVRRQARQAIGLKAAGVPQHLLALLHPVEADPAFHMTTAPFMQLAREWWYLGLCDGKGAPDELNGRCS